ncbi:MULTISPECIES: 3-oxoacyl-[acyl-carrier-protein] reductase [unclassified Thomasclavelia]|uniref:3-oxoacyl-[acyl-carrier-protein] reductase n=1 Tax=Candidatus Erysipelatoclostridium merdavium TaxID=2838566 RepID=A0A9D1XL91_9FIRM|nr:MULTISPECIES: 3-oxoacyl-[acyl-carrier-protein] reductase [unclassified Thomasclavelia]OUP75274.1 3-oxoacyl-[acyl-carrier-protein] reductase [Erysipelatoclostridium sp. An173]OUQ08867.1 3-oxoacyl-[acyl-carrier-protein] reductase [Erysipelatoclostridium sp. An15]HIX81527.1 3-oxoacyl-[acyl-carrier-protein] reductase [Candidatus Erysipelatoclostridium merdavium]
MKLKDKVVLVTGGAQGIGKEICFACAREGAKIVVNYIDIGDNKEIAQKTKDELEATGATVMLAQANVASFEETGAMVKEVVKEFGRIDVLVNNAGITKDNLLMRMKESDFDAVVDVNLKGTWNCMKHVTKIMMKQRYGRIISMSSVVGVMGNAGQVNYAATKSGIIGMTMSLAREVGSRGITVNAVAPGFIKTAMTDVLPDDIKENMIKQIPLGTLGEVSDIANTVVFLASDDAKYITGQTIHVDGGMAM